MAKKKDGSLLPLLPASKVAELHFADGTIDLGGCLFREDEQGQLIPVPETDPVFAVHEEWKRQAALAVRALLPLPARRKKSRASRRKQKK